MVMHDHKKILENAREYLPDNQMIVNLSNFYRTFASPTRVKILFSLLFGEKAVCCIAELLGIEQSLVSHQLKTLKQANLVDCKRQGKTIVYFLADEHIKSIVSLGLEHLMEEKV